MGHSDGTPQLSIDLDGNCDQLLQFKTRIMDGPSGCMNALFATRYLPAAFPHKWCIGRQDLRKETEFMVCDLLVLTFLGFNQVLKRVQRFHHMRYGGVVFERRRVFCHLPTEPVDC